MANVKAKEDTAMRKLKAKEISTERTRLLVLQGGMCKLCNHPVDPANAVLDHCHKTGQIRAVLHRTCNSMLGKIENAQQRFAIDNLRLQNIMQNLMEYKSSLEPMLHPTHRTPEEKKELQRKRNARKKKNKGL